MNPPRFRLTIVHLMVMVACAGSIFAAFRVDPIVGLFVTIVTIVVVFGSHRAITIGNRCRIAGKPLSRWESMKVLSCSFCVVILIVVASVFCALSIHATLLIIVPPFTSHASLGVTIAHLSAIAVAFLVGFVIVRLLRPYFWASPWTDRRMAGPPEIDPTEN